MIVRHLMKGLACIGVIFLLQVGVVQAELLAVPDTHIANANDATLVRAGMLQYKTYCAQCHGRNLQGQPLWQVQDADFHRRAPAQDNTGHTWQHSDEDLFQMIRTGRFPGTPPSANSYMPPFSALMRDQQILEVMAFIKARWAIGLRVSQASLNPGFAGMPEGSEDVVWTLPPNCSSSALQDWRKSSR